ncbi:unnamed protein product [Gongylonema pulchrum]|uniref:Secreted protein n=1 Tax=Gongylonema pulchrum TaxID=637853 RepID=A0A183D2R0_9BILA|nr:unnamed protein product [Gongylonema pulchrum]
MFLAIIFLQSMLRRELPRRTDISVVMAADFRQPTLSCLMDPTIHGHYLAFTMSPIQMAMMLFSLKVCRV